MRTENMNEWQTLWVTWACVMSELVTFCLGLNSIWHILVEEGVYFLLELLNILTSYCTFVLNIKCQVAAAHHGKLKQTQLINQQFGSMSLPVICEDILLRKYWICILDCRNWWQRQLNVCLVSINFQINGAELEVQSCFWTIFNIKT